MNVSESVRRCKTRPRVTVLAGCLCWMIPVLAGGCSRDSTTDTPLRSTSAESATNDPASPRAPLGPEREREVSSGGPSRYATNNMPVLLDLGADKCIPCKMMAPILDELREEHQGRLEVVFIDVWQKPEEAEKYGIESIPTQIFFDASGMEVFRHVGFFSKEDILAKWQEFGVELGE